jgi:hypothetical protein
MAHVIAVAVTPRSHPRIRPPPPRPASHASPARSWHLYQTHIDKFQYTHSVRHLAFSATPDAAARLVADDAGVFLVHGKPGSAGTFKYERKFAGGVPVSNATIYWNDEVEPGRNVSVMVRTWSGDAAYAAVALESARRCLPHALEFVAVTPERDAAAVRKALPKWARVVGEPALLPDDHIQASAKRRVRVDGRTERAQRLLALAYSSAHAAVTPTTPLHRPLPPTPTANRRSKSTPS